MIKLRRLLSLILCISVGMGVIASKPLYVYTASKGIRSFDTKDILSIDYIPEANGMAAMQNFVMPDSTYSIPVSEIDYVGFSTPETEYNQDVNQTKALSKYVYGANELTLFLNGSIPTDLIPKQDQILYIESSDESNLSLPFAGKVSSVTERSDTLLVSCNPVKLTDIFRTYYGVISDEQESHNRRESAQREGVSHHGTFTPDPIRFGVENFLNYEDIDDISFSSGSNWEEIISPKFDYSGYFILDPTYGISLSVDIISDLTIEDVITLGGGVSVSDDIKFLSVKKPIPEALMDIYFEVGITAQAEATISSDVRNSHSYRHVFHYDWNSKHRSALKPISNIRNTGNTHEGYWTVNGTLSAGIYVELGVAFIMTSDLDIAKLDVHFETGLQSQGNWVPSRKESQESMASTAFYKRMSDAYVETGLYTSGEAECHLFGWSQSYDETIFSNCNNFFPWQHIALVPEFGNTKAILNDYKSIDTSVSVKGNSFPCDLGLAVVNQENQEIQKIYTQYDYTGPGTTTTHKFDSLEPSTYKVYPLVKSLGIEMIADPYKQVFLNPITGNYTCVWLTTPPNAKLLSMILRDDNTMTQTYYYANRGENVTYNGTYSFDGTTLKLYKSNGEVQDWNVLKLAKNLLIIGQSDGFTYNLVK